MRITISGDGLTAEVTVGPGPSATAAELATQLREHEVRFGLQAAAIDSLAARIADPGFEARCVVAIGQRPADGVDGRLEIPLNPQPSPGRPGAADSIDYRERDLLCPIQAGQRIGRVVPPTDGAAGTSVRGTTIPGRPGREHRVHIGSGVRVVDGFLVADRSGVVTSDARQVDVVTLFTHAADVDYRSGNLHSEGSLAVRGDVQAGFTVGAANDVFVTGAVLDGLVTAGGSVQIEQGVLGPTSRVQAGGAIACRHATTATLEAEGVLTIGDQAVHCRLRAESLLMQKGRGALVGGEARVRQNIIVRSAGTANGAATRLLVGDVVDASAELLKATLADQKIGARAQLRGRGSDRGSGGKSLRQAVRLQDPAQQETLRIRQRQRDLLRTARIEVIDTLHPGVRVAFGEHEHQFTDPRIKVCLRWDATANKIIEENLP